MVLTVAGASCPRAVVTDEPLAAVADMQEVAGLSQAPSADPAAATAIQDQGGPTWAAGQHVGAVARPSAQLAAHLGVQSIAGLTQLMALVALGWPLEVILGWVEIDVGSAHPWGHGSAAGKAAVFLGSDCTARWAPMETRRIRNTLQDGG